MLLKSGDCVSLVATARRVTPDEVLPTVRLLESWGLRVRVPEGLYGSDNQFAGSDEHRAALFQRQLDDDAVRAIFCVRGGYGTVRMVDRLDFSRFADHPKWIVGYSDITVLHSHVARLCAVPTLHAIMPLNITDGVTEANSPAVRTLKQCLFEGRADYRFPASPLNRVGQCRATVVGGNLSVLYSLIASPSEVNLDGKILLIEDLDEYLYHIDRMMVALRRSGRLAHLAGLLVGGLTDMHDNAVPFGRDAGQIVREAVDGYGYPVAFQCPFGHIGQQNMALPLNKEAVLSVSENETFVLF